MTYYYRAHAYGFAIAGVIVSVLAELTVGGVLPLPNPLIRVLFGTAIAGWFGFVVALIADSAYWISVITEKLTDSD